MTQADVKGCIYLMSQLWSNYRTPGTEMEIGALVNTWLRFFGKARSEDVTQAIMEISAEGGEFAPQIGQIYAKYKGNMQPKIQGGVRDEIYAGHCNLLAKILDIDPPDKFLDNEGLTRWFERVRSERVI